MPVFKWTEDDTNSSLAFFPLVGAVIGGLVILLNFISPLCDLHAAVRIPLTILIPFLVTGGFHADGFMDTEDALNSYAPTERKLQILKDPNIGAFAVISLVKWLLAYTAAITAILLRDKDFNVLSVMGLIYVLSRAMSGLTSLVFKKTGKSGMLYEETKMKKKSVTAVLILWIILAVAGMVYIMPFHGSMIVIVTILYTLYYRYRAYKEFGGVTGDTAGFYLTTTEVILTAILAVSLYIFK